MADAGKPRHRRARRAAGIVTGVAIVPIALLAGGGTGAGAQSGGGTNPAEVGSFTQPFTEPTISDATGYPRVKTDERCIERPQQGGNQNQTGTQSPDPITGRGFIDCKPAAGGMNMLPNGKTLYWDNLAGTENVSQSILSEYGVVGLNDQSRLLDVGKRNWVEPTPVDAGAKSQADIDPIIPGELFRSTEDENDGSLFCADTNFLPDGRIMASGGTKYVNDPGNDASKYGTTELLGIENSRIYDPDTNKWTQTGSMNRPRWYPTQVTLGDGKQMIVSGLRRLVKPVNTQDPFDPTQKDTGIGLQEGQNERETETYDPATGKWTLNGNAARKSLPLFARTHLLPNGHVFYNAAGQAFNPLGQAYDEALWNIASSYDPEAKKWNDLGIPGVGASVAPGFRGSTFSVMMPLKPDANGNYNKASFLTGGGVTNPASPGGYVAIRDSYLTNVDTSNGQEKMSAEDTGDMNPTTTPASGRWYSQGTMLPTGEVLATSGADRDEVAVPGTEIPVMNAEMYDPETKTWNVMARQNRPRTYHNTANLRPDGRVLVGGHATISTSYLSNITFPGGVTAPNGRDPSFEVYSPPYMSYPGQQTSIKSVRGSGQTLQLDTTTPASQIENVVLVRNTSTTHIVDADQRTVELKILSRDGNSIQVAQVNQPGALPPGPYMLFVNRKTSEGLQPSKAAQVTAVQGGRVRPLAGCLAKRSPIGNANVGRVKLGMKRDKLGANPRLARIALAKEPQVYTYCVRRTAKKVRAVFGRGTKVELVTSNAPGHGNRKLRPGQRSTRVKRAYPKSIRIARGTYRVSRRSRRIIGVRKGRIQYVGVASKRVLRKGNRKVLRRYLRRAGYR